MTVVRHESGPDAGAVWHYGDPLREQRWLAAGEASVDLSHRPTFSITGPDRLTWLNNIVSQKLDDLASDAWVTAYILDPNGRIVHVFGGVDDGADRAGGGGGGGVDAMVPPPFAVFGSAANSTQ